MNICSELRNDGRRQKNYDVRVKQTQFKGDWVWYYYTRRYTQKSPKWQDLYTGPFKVSRILPSLNTVIQRSKRTKPFVVLIEKLNKCYEETPTSEKREPVVDESEKRDCAVNSERPARIVQHQPTTRDAHIDPDPGPRLRRSTRRPRYRRDFV